MVVKFMRMFWREITRFFKRERSSKRIYRSGSRNRYGDIPDVDFYDSVDIDDKSYNKTNGGASFVPRSGDFSKSSLPLDNPASRRSFEIRRNTFSRTSWYDPDATSYEYSQMNANLVSGTSRSQENRRSVSSSRLHNGEMTDGHSVRRQRGRSLSAYTTIHDHVPKCYTETNTESPYQQRDRYIRTPTEVKASDYTGLPRRSIEQWNPKLQVRTSYRSRSFDQHLHTGHLPREKEFFMSVSNVNSRSRYKKTDSPASGTHRSRKDKHNIELIKMKETRPNNERFYRAGSTGRNCGSQHDFFYCPDHRDLRADIVSSNLQPVAYVVPNTERQNKHSHSNRKHNRSHNEHSSQLNKTHDIYTTRL